jgi:hypothetical protein
MQSAVIKLYKLKKSDLKWKTFRRSSFRIHFLSGVLVVVADDSLNIAIEEGQVGHIGSPHVCCCCCCRGIGEMVGIRTTLRFQSDPNWKLTPKLKFEISFNKSINIYKINKSITWFILDIISVRLFETFLQKN